MDTLPLDLRVLVMLRDRVPHIEWGARRVILAVRDFEDIVDVELVAQRCCDWLMGPDAQRVKDGPAQLRRYLEQERARCAPNVTSLRSRLAVYNQPDTVSHAPSHGGTPARESS